MKYQIYTDGACSGNPGPGGWAAIIIDENGFEIILKGGAKETTNNKMELTAFIEAIKSTHLEEPEIELYSDSKYLIDGINSWLPNWKKRGWKNADKKPVKNLELWQEIDKLTENINLKLIWVKGHNENKYNEMADRIAVEESMKF